MVSVSSQEKKWEWEGGDRKPRGCWMRKKNMIGEEIKKRRRVKQQEK